MGYLTKWGGMWGSVPKTTGSVFFVAPISSTSSSYVVEGRTYQANDDNDGLSPERALGTITQAITNCTASAGDVIVLLPGTHNASSPTGAKNAAGALAFNKAGITVVGVPYDHVRPALSQAPQAIITAPASTVACVLTAADLTFSNVSFLGVSGQKSVSYTTACHRLTVRGCYFDLTVGAASTAGLAGTGATQAPTLMLVEDCIFAFDNTGTSGSYGLDVSAAVAYLVRNNHFRFNAQGAGVAAHTAAVKVNDNAQGVFDGNAFYGLITGTATLTDGILGVNMTGTGVIRMYRNLVGAIVTNPFTGFAASDADLLNNYIGTVAGGTGGTLITSTT